MKKIVLLCFTALVLFSCRPASVDGMQAGDLIFIGLPADYHLYNRDYVQSPDAPQSFEDLIIHTAIADVDKDGIWVIDATIAHGVDRHPLDVMLSDFALKEGYACNYIVMRLKDDKHAKKYVKNAKAHLGKSYNTNFAPCDTALYCTELVQVSYVKPGGKHFPGSPNGFHGPRRQYARLLDLALRPSWQRGSPGRPRHPPPDNDTRPSVSQGGLSPGKLSLKEKQSII